MESAIIGHLVGDYLVQNDWMAQNKKKQILPCLVHCFLWTLSVCLLAEWTNPLVIGILFVTHFIQDHTDIIKGFMFFIGQEKFATGILSPWSIIVVDNVWHLVTIWLVWKFLV